MVNRDLHENHRFIGIMGRMLFFAVFVVLSGVALPVGAESDKTPTIPSDTWIKESGSRIAPGTYPDPDCFGAQTQDVVHFPAGAPVLNPDGTVVAAPERFLRMYYGGVSTLLHQVLSAVSFDEGLTWTKEPGIRLATAPDEDVSYHPSVIRYSDDSYRMYFESESFSVGLPRIRSAHSSDGLTWVRDAGDRLTNAIDAIVVKIKAQGLDEQEEGSAADGEGKYRLYFGRGGDILSAVSSDGITWTEEPGVRLAKGAPGTIDGSIVSHFYVIQLKNKKFKMYYTAADGITPTLHGNGLGRAILSARSCDGLNWVKDDGIRIDMGIPGSLDARSVLQPTVIRLSDGSFRMFYQGGVAFNLRYILSAHADAASEEEDFEFCKE